MDEHLNARAQAWGVRTEYEDYRGERHEVPATTIEHVLDVLGADQGTPPPPAAVVARQGTDVDVSGYSQVRAEDGGTDRLRRALPRDLPPGYHVLVGRDERETPLIYAPARCYLPAQLRTWGWAVQLYSLRSQRSWGIGDLGDLRRLGAWASSDGAGVLLVNPLHAAIPGPHQQPSPYFPSSRRFRNPLYVALDAVPGRRDAADQLMSRARALNDRAHVDRDDVYALKMQALRTLWETNRPSDGFERFRKQRGAALRDYATFAALAEAHGGGRSSFPQHYARPGSPEVERWRREHDDEVGFHAWLQWLLELQLRAAADDIGVINDLAIGVDPDGADAWAWQDSFAQGVKVGAPPDEFNRNGQDWGLPPFDPWKLRADAYRPFIETVRAGMQPGAGIRIDHVMGLFRLYWIPEGTGPDRGTYVNYPHHDLLDIVALESHRARAFVIGEDLGTVEPFVREEMQRRRMLSYRLMWFEQSPPSDYPELALAAVTNHDLPTVTGLWTGSDLDEQHELDLSPNVGSTEASRRRLRELIGVPNDAKPATVIPKTYEALGRAPSAVVIATLEDALAVERRPNMPGTTQEQRPNWSLPLPRLLEDIEADPLPSAIARALASRDRASAPKGGAVRR